MGKERGAPLRSWPTLAKTTLAKTHFGQTEFDLLCVVCLCVLCGVGAGFTVSWCGVSRVGVGFKVLVWSCFVPLDSPSPRTALPLDRSNFALFSPLPLQNSFYFSLSGVFSWNFGGVFEGRDTQVCTFGLSGCRVKPRRIWAVVLDFGQFDFGQFDCALP